MKKVPAILIGIVFTGFSLVAGVTDKNRKPTDDKKAKKDDTTKVVYGNDMLMDEVDSLLMFPSHDLYGSWDTSVIHPYSFDKEFLTDSTTIYLLDDWNCGFTLPFKGHVTSEFGWRRRRPHFGTDINLETGDTVVAAFDGKVRIAKLNKSYGNVVIIRHNNGLETVYAHLSKILVDPDQQLTAGTVIGLGGNTGHSFGSHLHFEVRYLGKAIDAKDMIDFEKGEVKNNSFVLYKDDFKARYDLKTLHSHDKASRSHSFAKHTNFKKSAKSKSIKVKNGDTLAKIAKRNHISVAALCKKNGIKHGKAIRTGQKIKV